MSTLGAGLELLNINGCGVCKNRVLLDLLSDEDLGLLGRFFKRIGDYFKDKEKTLYCGKHKKYMKPTAICTDYDGIKQIKMYGTKVDEQIRFDTAMVKGVGNGSSVQMWK